LPCRHRADGHQSFNIKRSPESTSAATGKRQVLQNGSQRCHRNEDIGKRESDVVNSLSADKQQMIADLLTEANKHIGKPYRHGMKGPNAFDCSGFTSYVYKQFGYSISPASRIQYTDGVKVDRKNLRKGDLVFFTSRSSGKNVGHVGIVVSADNETGKFKFIHASIKGVRVNECEGYYENRYVGARRIITE
jgi:cell wall-associated NlpC family hydrolase